MLWSALVWLSFIMAGVVWIAAAVVGIAVARRREGPQLGRVEQTLTAVMVPVVPLALILRFVAPPTVSMAPRSTWEVVFAHVWHVFSWYGVASYAWRVYHRCARAKGPSEGRNVRT